MDIMAEQDLLGIFDPTNVLGICEEPVGHEWTWLFTPLSSEVPYIPPPVMKQPESGTTYEGWYK
jgi:hypothetical protein